MSRRLSLCLALLGACLAGGLTGGATPASATPLNCPGAFQVLHDDQIGEDFRVPAGGYLIKVADPRLLSCATAAKNFAEFLDDYDGVLRKPWVRVPDRPIFARGDGSMTAFSIRLVAGLDPAVPVAGNPTANGCPGFFRVLHDDHIGSMPMPEGPYRISLLNPATLTCAAAAKQLARFLSDVDGQPTRPWRFTPRTGTFQRGRSTAGFRVKTAVGAQPDPGQATRLPMRGQPGECRGSFRSLAFDRIGSLPIVAGNYLTFPARGSGLSCRRVSQLFAAFLRAKGNRLPKPWKVDSGTGTFTRGKRPGFRVKPELKVVAKTPAAAGR